MKTIVFLILAGGISFSCKNIQKQEVTENQQPAKELTKLEQLYLLPKDSVYEFYDLSNDSIKEFPDLSEYTIKKLNLSHNQIDSLIQNRLPKGIESLNLSNNLFIGFLYLEMKKKMKNIDFSHNKIGDCYIEINVNKLAINDNDLKNITLIFDQMNYLDISNNPMLSNIVGFKPEYIDTIIRKNIKNNKKLIFVVDSWPKTID